MPPKDVLERMYVDEGMTQSQIAKEFDVSQVTIGRWLSHHGISSVGHQGAPVPMPPKYVLERMYVKEGMNQWHIAKGFNVSQPTVTNWMSHHGIQARVPIPPKDVLERMYNDEGNTQEQIAKEFDVSRGAVINWMYHYNIQARVPMPQKYELESLITEGLNQLQIAEHFGVSDVTIFRWCECLDIPGMVDRYRCMTDEHIAWRYAVFYRDHHTCQKCGATNTHIQAHHIVPYSDHPEIAYEIENGITLCQRCHKQTFDREYEYITQFAVITQPHLHKHEVIESMPWEPPLELRSIIDY